MKIWKWEGDGKEKKRKGMGFGEMVLKMIEGMEDIEKWGFRNEEEGIMNGNEKGGEGIKGEKCDKEKIRGEIKRIGEKVDEKMIDREEVWIKINRVLDKSLERDVIILGMERDYKKSLIDEREEIDLIEIEREMKGIDIRNIKNVIDEVEKEVEDGVDVVDILIIEVGKKREESEWMDNLREEDDRIERSEKIVGNIGEELRFGKVGRLREIILKDVFERKLGKIEKKVEIKI